MAILPIIAVVFCKEKLFAHQVGWPAKKIRSILVFEGMSFSFKTMHEMTNGVFLEILNTIECDVGIILITFKMPSLIWLELQTMCVISYLLGRCKNGEGLVGGS